MFPATITQALWPWARSRDMRPASEPSLYLHGDLVRDRFWYAQNHLAYRGLNKSDRHVASERASCPLPDDPQCPAIITPIITFIRTPPGARGLMAPTLWSLR